MPTADNFIVAIDLGSSKVTALAGRKQPDGAIEVLAFAQEPSTTFIRKGRINNVSKMMQCIGSMKDKLEKKLQRNISRVYVGIGGMGMHTVANRVARNFGSKTEITQEIVDSMCDENRASASPDRDILECVPQEYRLGTQSQIEPVGILSESIEGRYLNIVASSSVREEIRNCFRTAGVAIADLPIMVQALADTLLTEPERRSGCVFVDMGSETTSVAVFKNNLLRHLAVIPLGGANVNRDIMSLQIEDDEAEELKIKYGSAICPDESDSERLIELRDGRSVKYEDFNALVEARNEEIILNVNNQIKLSGYDKTQLIGGLVIAGGASHMRNIEKAFSQITQFEKIRFVRTIKISLRVPSDLHDFNKDGDCNAAIALIEKGDINCCGGTLGAEPDIFEPPKEPVKTPEEIAAEEAKKKAEQEEAERKAAEEAAEEQRRKEQEEKERQAAERKEKTKNTLRKIGRFFSGLVREEDDDITTRTPQK